MECLRNDRRECEKCFLHLVEIASKNGIQSIIQPGGSIKDQLSIDSCNKNSISMVMTGNRHFKH